jgi:hypothetical protein
VTRPSLNRRIHRFTGWLAILLCASIALSILLSPSWASFAAGGFMIAAFGLIGRSLLKSPS